VIDLSRSKRERYNKRNSSISPPNSAQNTGFHPKISANLANLQVLAYEPLTLNAPNLAPPKAVATSAITESEASCKAALILSNTIFNKGLRDSFSWTAVRHDLCYSIGRSQLLLRNIMAVKGTDEEEIRELLGEGGVPLIFLYRFSAIL